MPDRFFNPPVSVTLDQVAAILQRELGQEVLCTGLRRLSGGCVYTVLEVTLAPPTLPVVIKLSPRLGDEKLRTEYAVLDYLRQHTDFPVPWPFACNVSGESLPYSYLIVERLPGENLATAEATLSIEQRMRLQRDMGEAVAALHTHTRERYGYLTRAEGYERWAEFMQEALLDNYRECEASGLLSAETLAQVRQIIDAVPGLLDAPCPPTLTHGDIWATNIMVHEGRLAGFLDPAGVFAHREYELAYLELWGTADEVFFETYLSAHPYLEGYERRRLVYWLNSLLLHTWCFESQEYARRAQELVQDLLS